MNFTLFYLTDSKNAYINSAITNSLEKITRNSIVIIPESMNNADYHSDRINVIVGKTNKMCVIEDVCDLYVTSIDDAFKIIDIMWGRKKIFLIGLDLIKDKTFDMKNCDEIIVCKVNEIGNGEIMTIGDEFIQSHYQTNGSEHITFYIRYYEEQQYLNLITKCLKQSPMKHERTNKDTYDLFGEQLKFNLSNGVIPLITTKKTFWKGIVEELLWFIRGETNTKSLVEKKVHFWDANASKENLKSLNLPYEEGELGPVYGHQWRNFGGSTGTKGVDQLKYCINLIKTEPTSRRIVMSAWNPQQIPEMALPPCHLMAQFAVSKNQLHCHMYQRSADVGLGLPFNIASYALLTHLMATICCLTAGTLTMSLGCVHVYEDHVEALKAQTQLKPYRFPTVEIDNLTTLDDLMDLDFSKNIKLKNYIHHKPIKMDMTV